MGTDKIFPSPENRENSTSSKFMNFSWVGLGGGGYKSGLGPRSLRR